MDSIAPYFQMSFQSTANPAAVVQVEQARFTLLADRLIRMEYSPTGRFEDRASQAFWYREQPIPDFQIIDSAGWVRIETSALVLRYQPGQPFSADSLSVDLKEVGTTWHFGDPDPGNLGGTARTLDGVDGAIPLSLGLVSRSGWSVIDDSASLVFNQRCWLEPRQAPAEQRDLYFLGYGHDYLACLRDFNRVSGPVPMIPRWVLGNWWSRYWAYTQQDLTQLVQDFKEKQVPLSVCIIDMDWHITKTGNDSSGWTGYSWNRDLFPDPTGLLSFMKESGLKVALNLHPAEGIHRHESAYKQMCAAVGQDPAAGEPVAFDIAEPSFVKAYFDILHHPMEASGIDFWWMDWQQGLKSKVMGLDPLWWLNHLHFYDLGRDGSHRSFIFSRWGGLGNHRYPIGFSGDTVVSWASLAFQPYFTATASNVNYGWWSHDIGGHMSGIEDAELYARWVQLGVFLPVLRMHATKNPYQDRRPWLYDAETFQVLRDALQLRHALIPYLYSLAWRYHHENVPPLLPMYYMHPEQEEAYNCPNQYLFGSQLIVAPFITPKDPETGLSRAVVWLPEGDWVQYFSGQHLSGNRWQAVYGGLNEIPVFARAGALIPQAPPSGWGGTGTPEQLVLNIFAGDNGRFELYDDEGNTNTYLEGAYAITPLVQAWDASQTRVVIGPSGGDTSLVPARRQVDLYFRGFNSPQQVVVRLNGAVQTVESRYNPADHTLALPGLLVSPSDQLEVVLTVAAGAELANRNDSRLVECLKLLKHFRMETGAKAALAALIPEIIADPGRLAQFLLTLTDSQARALYEVITGAGIELTATTGQRLVVMWNNHSDTRVTCQRAVAHHHEWWRYPERFPWSNETLPRFEALHVDESIGHGDPWVVQATYYGTFTHKVGTR